MSIETGFRGAKTARPAPSAAGSLGSGGRAASGIRVTIRGATSTAPAPSHGAGLRPAPSHVTVQPTAEPEQLTSPTSKSPAPAAAVAAEPVAVAPSSAAAAAGPGLPPIAPPPAKKDGKKKRQAKRQKVEVRHHLPISAALRLPVGRAGTDVSQYRKRRLRRDRLLRRRQRYCKTCWPSCRRPRSPSPRASRQPHPRHRQAPAAPGLNMSATCCVGCWVPTGLLGCCRTWESGRAWERQPRARRSPRRRAGSASSCLLAPRNRSLRPRARLCPRPRHNQQSSRLPRSPSLEQRYTTLSFAKFGDPSASHRLMLASLVGESRAQSCQWETREAVGWRQVGAQACAGLSTSGATGRVGAWAAQAEAEHQAAQGAAAASLPSATTEPWARPGMSSTNRSCR